jgi:hypothetical protein
MVEMKCVAGMPIIWISSAQERNAWAQREHAVAE